RLLCRGFPSLVGSLLIRPLSLHAALPICACCSWPWCMCCGRSGSSAGSAERGAPTREGAAGPAQGTIHPAARNSSYHSARVSGRSEEHTSELQSREKLVCRLPFEKKKK